LLRLFFVLMLLLASTAALADHPSSSKVKARASFIQGQTLYRQGSFAQALAAFAEAARHIKHPSITINMAQCHRNLGNASKAIFFYRLYLSQWKRPYPARLVPHEREVHRHVLRLEATVK